MAVKRPSQDVLLLDTLCRIRAVWEVRPPSLPPPVRQGIIVFSSLIGRVTALLTKRNQEVAEHMRESERLRSLCSDRGIRLHLAKRVMQFISSPRRRIVWVTEDDVACLKTMPRSLLIELRHGMYSKVLSPHALFRLLGDACHALMLEVCNSAVKETTTDVGDTACPGCVCLGVL